MLGSHSDVLAPVVYHCDADAFFAACHISERPELADVPMVVAGNPEARHGIVLTASYPARRYGVRTAMPLFRARALCPDLLVVPPNPALYRARADAMRIVFGQFSPVVEPLSIDEAWLDMTGAWHLWGGQPTAAASVLQQAVRAACGLSVSVGISSNKMLAKQVSDWAKPEGVTVLWPEQVAERLSPRPVGDLYGVGPRLASRLTRMGVDTIGALATMPIARLRDEIGQAAATLARRARGQDDGPVVVPTEASTLSLGAETTLAHDVSRRDEAEPVLLGLADHVAGRLRRHGRTARTVVLKYKTARFVSHTHQMQLAHPTANSRPLYDAAVHLFVHRAHLDPVRLLGLSVTGLDARPLGHQSWWGDASRDDAMARAVDQIRGRFGPSAIMPARLLSDRSTYGGSSFERPDPRQPGRKD